MDVSKVTRKGQVTIPSSIRDRLGIEVGSHVAFSVEDNKVVLRPVVADVRRLFGVVESDRSVSLKEMDEAVSRMGGESDKKR